MVAGTTGAFLNGFSNTLLSGQSIGKAFGQAGKDALIGAGIGALAGATFGMIDALTSGKNVWLGRDIGMGGHAWSFKNIDLPATHYFSDSHKGTNVRPIEELVSKYEQTRTGLRGDVNNRVASPATRSYEGQVLPPQERSIWVGNMKGRGYLEYSGYIEEGFNLSISFDGNNVVNLHSGNYSSTNIIIPSGTKYINISVNGQYTYPTGTIYPFNTRIMGIPKFY